MRSRLDICATGLVCEFETLLDAEKSQASPSQASLVRPRLDLCATGFVCKFEKLLHKTPQHEVVLNCNFGAPFAAFAAVFARSDCAHAI